MPDLTSPNPTGPDGPPLDPPSGPPPSPEPQAPSPVSFHALWIATDGTKQSALAGMVTDRPELREAELTADEWQAALNEYLESPRP